MAKLREFGRHSFNHIINELRNEIEIISCYVFRRRICVLPNLMCFCFWLWRRWHFNLMFAGKFVHVTISFSHISTNTLLVARLEFCSSLLECATKHDIECEYMQFGIKCVECRSGLWNKVKLCNIAFFLTQHHHEASEKSKENIFVGHASCARFLACSKHCQ